MLGDTPGLDRLWLPAAPASWELELSPMMTVGEPTAPVLHDVDIIVGTDGCI